MNLDKTLFAQIMDFLPWKLVHRIASRHKGDHYVQHFSYAEQFRVMAFAQLSYRDEPFGADLAGSVYAFDASTIDLRLPLLPWAHFDRAKSTTASIKLHTLLELRGDIPSFIHLSNGQNRWMADARGLDTLSLEAGAIYVMDRGYLDFTRLYRLHQPGASL